MSDKFKKKVRALAAEQGVSYQTALNILTQGKGRHSETTAGAPEPEPHPRSMNLFAALMGAAHQGRTVPIMTGVPITLRLEVEGGQFVAYCHVQPFSSPFVASAQAQEVALQRMGGKLLQLLNALKTRHVAGVDMDTEGPATADFDFDGRYFQTEGRTWREAFDKLKRMQSLIASHLEKLAGLRPVRSDERWGVVDGASINCTMTTEGELFVVSCRIPWYGLVVKKHRTQFQALVDVEAALKTLQEQQSDQKVLDGIDYCLQWASYFKEFARRHEVKLVDEASIFGTE